MRAFSVSRRWLGAFFLSGALLLAAPALRAQQSAPVPAVDTSNRQAVLDLYAKYYVPDVNPPDPGWTGSLADGEAGTLSEAFLQSALRRINYYRAMSGLNGDVTFSAADNARCQQAALMCAAEGGISHVPPASWPFHTADAALACADSNLRLATDGDEGPAAIDGYMADDESNNYYVGHRRWLVYPGQSVMGMGAVPTDAVSHTHPGVNATWILNAAPRPANAPAATAWPPAGYVPAPLLFRRWSFSCHGADLSAATVSVVKHGAALPVAVEPVIYQALNGSGTLVGENTLVWELPTNAPASFLDETYTVTVGNILADGKPRQMSYTVTTVNPPDPAEAVVLPAVGITALKPAAHLGGKGGRFLITRTGDLSQPLSVRFLTSGTAQPGVDYPALPGPAVIPAGSASLKLRVAAKTGAGRTVTLTLKPKAKNPRFTVAAGAGAATVVLGL